MPSPETGRIEGPRAVFFDLDDTLFDHTLTSRGAVGVARRSVPALRRVPLARLVGEYQQLLQAGWRRVVRGRTSPDEARVDRWRQLVALHVGRCSVADARALSRAYARAYRTIRRPIPGAVGLVRRVAERSAVAIVTNGIATQQREKLRFLGLQGAVDHLIVSDEVGTMKPARPIFRAALRATSARPEESVMIGDSWSNDVLGAREAGIRPIWFNRFHLPRPADADGIRQTDSLRPVGRIASLLLRAPPRTGTGRGRGSRRPR